LNEDQNKKDNIKSFQKELRKRETTFNRIIEWKKLADIEPDKIKRFILRWISFNGLYFASYSMDSNEDEAERAKEFEIIENFCDKFILTNKILASKIYSDKIKKDFNENIKDKSRHMGDYLKNLNCDKSVEEKAKNLIMIAYKIRCRLFHGKKNPLLEVNQTIIEAADKIIATILNEMIKE